MAGWNPGKQEANYSYSDRSFDGVSSMWLRKSADEAPEVGTYNYDDVSVQAYDSGTTDLTDFNSQWTTTLLGEQIVGKSGKSEAAAINVDTLLNDVWFSVMIGDNGKMVSLLERARVMGIEYPADFVMKNMFGDSTLWSRIHDSEFKISGGVRDSAIRMMTPYHRRDL